MSTGQTQGNLCGSGGIDSREWSGVTRMREGEGRIQGILSTHGTDQGSRSDADSIDSREGQGPASIREGEVQGIVSTQMQEPHAPSILAHHSPHTHRQISTAPSTPTSIHALPPSPDSITSEYFQWTLELAGSHGNRGKEGPCFRQDSTGHDVGIPDPCMEVRTPTRTPMQIPPCILMPPSHLAECHFELEEPGLGPLVRDGSMGSISGDSDSSSERNLILSLGPSI